MTHLEADQDWMTAVEIHKDDLQDETAMQSFMLQVSAAAMKAAKIMYRDGGGRQCSELVNAEGDSVFYRVKITRAGGWFGSTVSDG